MKLIENIELIGSSAFAYGGFAALYKARLRSEEPFKDQIVVVKVPDKCRINRGGGIENVRTKENTLERWKRELNAGQGVLHPNIIQPLGFCDNPDPIYKDFVGKVLPFCENGTARSYIYANPGVDRLRILVLVASALFTLHGRPTPVVHGDIKAANILIDKHGNPLLSDFGMSRISNSEGYTTNNVMGSTRWMSVELLHACTASTQIDMSPEEQIVRTTKESDVWALSMTVLEILTGKLPYAEYKYDGGVVIGIVANDARPKRPQDSRISDTIWTLLERCWVEDLSKRPDARHVGLALDVIYGTSGELDPLSVSSILEGALDHLVPHLSPDISSQRDHSLLPYGCKWIHCSQAYDNIDACVAHECEEFSQRKELTK